ncbi:MarR family winged helix-turn-helix transcriptional regulator [Massilia aerilata]|uniref:MarR family winged helix-turn-helix transcriptional regulator n=1 Tax=Massilia aerilata TaxID=453817 RepID=A0ABW0RYR7_9BURK
MLTLEEGLNEHLSERFTQALQAGGRAWQKALERQLKPCGLTAAGWSAIAALADMQRAGAKDPHPPSQTALAQQLGVDGATLVATIDRLTAARLIERIPSQRDRRVKLVVLTQEGRELEEKVRVQADALRREALARLDPGEVALAVGVLEQLQQVLESA